MDTARTMDQVHLSEVWREQHSPLVDAGAVDCVGRGPGNRQQRLIVSDNCEYRAIQVPLEFKDGPHHGSHLEFKDCVVFLIRLQHTRYEVYRAIRWRVR